MEPIGAESPNAESVDAESLAAERVDGEPAGASGRRARLLGDLLPACYREDPGFLRPLLEATIELLGDLRDGARRAEASFPGAARDLASRWGFCAMGDLAGERAREGSGCRGDLLAWLASRLGQAPRVADGLRAVPHGGRWLQLRRAAGGSVLLVWDRASLPVVPEGFEIPRDLLPPSVSVQAALISRRLSSSRLLAGERIQGAVFWQSPGSSEGPGFTQGPGVPPSGTARGTSGPSGIGGPPTGSGPGPGPGPDSGGELTPSEECR